MNKNKIIKTFPSDPDILPQIEQFVMEIAAEANLNEDKYNNLALSVAEASSNSIIHGNDSDPKKMLEVEIEYDNYEIRVKFKDQGKGFDIGHVPDPTAPENILKDHGRGIHIMRSFLDDLKFSFSEEGTEVTLVLKLN
ncbi:MAG: ATP-binding protein [Melioribacteraceae bacterium]|nr:ATP-binding protein [Melioribacteraceae bacterium]